MVLVNLKVANKNLRQLSKDSCMRVGKTGVHDLQGTVSITDDEIVAMAKAMLAGWE